MATKAETAEKAAEKKDNIIPDDRVEVFIPRGSANDDQNFFIGLNGVNYILPKGKKSLVPRDVAFEIRRSLAAQEAQDNRIQEMLDRNQ